MSCHKTILAEKESKFYGENNEPHINCMDHRIEEPRKRT
jgi:hypothetical protein